MPLLLLSNKKVQRSWRIHTFTFIQEFELQTTIAPIAKNSSKRRPFVIEVEHFWQEYRNIGDSTLTTESRFQNLENTFITVSI